MKTGRMEEAKNISRPTPQPQRKKAGSPASFRQTSPVVPDRRLLTREIFNADLRQLIALLSRKSPPQAVLLSFLQILQELPADSRDAHLVMILLEHWQSLNPDELSPNAQEKLAHLEKFFPQAGIPQGEGRQTGDDPFLLFRETSWLFGKKSSFALKLRRRKAKREGREGPAALVLEMNLPRLGILEVSVSPGNFHTSCRISCGDRHTMSLLRKALPDLKKQLYRDKGSVPRIFVKLDSRLSFGSSGSLVPEPGKGLNLWG